MIATKKLKIGIFIEADCSFSKKFITGQFRPAYNGLKEKIDVEFFTFGKSESYVDEDGNVRFKCQHGPEVRSYGKVTIFI